MLTFKSQDQLLSCEVVNRHVHSISVVLAEDQKGRFLKHFILIVESSDGTVVQGIAPLLVSPEIDCHLILYSVITTRFSVAFLFEGPH